MLLTLVYLEILHGYRRGWQHRIRIGYAGWLILQFGFLCFVHWMGTLRITGEGDVRAAIRQTREFFDGYFEFLLLQQLGVLLVAVPAFAAGSITDEKTRGTLEGLLAANLTASEIILGKLLGQMARVAEIALAGVPLLVFLGILTGLDGWVLAALVLSTMPPLLALAAISLLASVWCRKTSEAVIGVYGVVGVGAGLGWALGPQLAWFDPREVVETAIASPNPAETVWGLMKGTAAWGSMALGCTLMAIGRLRPAYLHQLTAHAPRGRRLLQEVKRPAVSELPIRWKERFVEKFVAVPGFRLVPRRLGMLVAFGLALFSSIAILAAHLPADGDLRELGVLLGRFDLVNLGQVLWRIHPAGLAFHGQGLAITFLISLLVGIRCSGSVCGEREQKTWEPLLLTPLEPRQLVRGKLWGVIDASRPYLLACLLPMLVLSVSGGTWAFVWTGLAWAMTWVMMYLLGACGIACSVRAASSWRSLLMTLLTGYRVVFWCYLMAGLPLGVILAGFILSALAVVMDVSLLFGSDTSYQVVTLATHLVASPFLFAQAERFLQEAEQHISREERVPQEVTAQAEAELGHHGRR